MSDRHAERELRIFSAFVDAAQLPVDNASVEKRNPPDPDIRCIVSGEGPVAFELVELVDPEFAERISLMFKTKNMLRDFFKNLPVEKNSQFEEKYNNALLLFRFHNGTLLRNRESALDAAYDHLLGLDPDFKGETYIDLDFNKTLKSIRIDRGNFVGPIFDPESVGWVGDPTRDTLTKKFGKNYSTEHPIELLAYIDIHPMLPDDIWLPQVTEFVETEAGKSKFGRIWVFDLHNDSIRYRYPNL